MDVLINSMRGIISQCMCVYMYMHIYKMCMYICTYIHSCVHMYNISNHHVVHFKYITILFIDYTSINLKKAN